MNGITVTITAEQLEALGAITLDDHTKMIVGGLICREIHNCHKRAIEPDNYLWNISEGAGAAFMRALRTINPAQYVKVLKQLGDAYSWRRNAEQPNGVAVG